MRIRFFEAAAVAMLSLALLPCQLSAAKIAVHFDKPLQVWDGFGVNYVETSQTRDYSKWPQDYGGFSTLTEKQRQEILEAIFGQDGLKPGIVKMFIDPFHEGVEKSGNDNNDPMKIELSKFTHERTTKWMRYFVRQGLKRTRAAERDLTIFCTLYGPPAWTTKQKIVRGRDLDPSEKYECAEYIVAFAKFMREEEGFPVNYVGLHNEGEHSDRWPEDGTDNENYSRHDYNMYWPPEQVVDFLTFMRKTLDANGLQDVGLTPGETTYWYRFRPIADAIVANDRALKNLSLITSHGFIGSSDPKSRWYNPDPYDNVPIATLRAKRPELHAWTTSATWGKMDISFIDTIRGHIYDTKVNGYIPWAAVQRHSQWVGGDPNPGTAFFVDDKGNYEIRPGYYLYKQVTRAGQPGMAVASVSSDGKDIGVIAFASCKTNNCDAFVVFNRSERAIPLEITITGCDPKGFSVFRTSTTEKYAKLPDTSVDQGRITYDCPPSSVTTFFAQ